MSEEPTQNLNDGRSFEERVFARFDALDASFRDLNTRVERLEARSYDTKPIWEQALKEITESRQELKETRREVRETRRELSRRLDRVELVVLQTKSHVEDLDDRVDKLESESAK